MSDRFQMDLADARLVELIRSRERDLVSQLTIMQMHMQQLQGDLQGTRQEFMTTLQSLGEKYGAQLQHYTINPYTGEAVINPQMANLQHRIQSAMAQQKAAAGKTPPAPPADVPLDVNGQPPVPAEPGEVPAGEVEHGNEPETQADEGAGVQAEPEAAEGEEAAK